jgi:tetratricopeptide (TPR) repeat protein
MVRTKMPISDKKPGKISAPATGASTARVRVLLLLGLILIGGAWAVRSSPWMHETLLRSKDLSALEVFVQQHPDDALARYYLGKRYFQNGRFAEASAAYSEAARLDPNSAQNRIELGYALFEQRQLKQANAEFLEAKRLDGRLAAAEYMLGKVAWSSGDMLGAAGHLKHATDMDPRFDEAWYGLALCLIQTRQSEEALRDVQKAIAINGNRAQYFSTLGDLELKLSDNTAEARQQFERALQLDPNYGQACALMGDLLVHHYDHDEQAALARAETLLLKATQLPTFRPQDVYRDLGQVYILRGQYQQAISPLQASIRLEPNDERAYFALVKAYHKLGNTGAAEATQKRFRFISDSSIQMYALQTHLSLQPKDAAAHLKLARIYLDFKMVSQAALQYRDYLSLRPDAHDLALEQRFRNQTAADVARLQQRSELLSLQSR